MRERSWRARKKGGGRGNEVGRGMKRKKEEREVRNKFMKPLARQ